MPSRKKLKPCLFLVSFFALLLTGCVDETSDGLTQTFKYTLSLPISCLIAGPILAAFGWTMRQSVPRLGWGLLIGGPILALVVAPSLYLDRGTVNEQGIELRSGIWGLTAVHKVTFDDLKSITVESKDARGRRGRKYKKYYMSCEHFNQPATEIPVNNKVAEETAIAFLERAVSKGVKVLNLAF